jgi:hypothetical protein
LQAFKTNLFWSPIVWYDTTYQTGKDVKYTVQIYSDIQALTPAVGDYIKVLDNGQGKWLLYEVLPAGDLNLIGAEAGTFKVNAEVYDVTVGAGYDSAVFDAVGFDPQAVEELIEKY